MTAPVPAPPVPALVPPTPAPTPPVPPTSELEKHLPQSRVNEIVAARTAEAKQKAADELTRDLGVPLDDAKAIIKAAKDKQESEQSEAQRARAAADKEKAEATEQKTAAAQEVHETRADSALLKAGALNDEDTLTRMRGLLTVKAGATKEEIAADVEKVKKTFPALFDVIVLPSRRTPHSDPPGHPNPAPPKDGMERGRERARAEVAARTTYPKPPGVAV